jgi:hypothetical protein
MVKVRGDIGSSLAAPPAPPRKENEMKSIELKPCTNCGKGLLHTGVPLFWRVNIERFGVDLNAARRQVGLEQFFGGGSVGAVMATTMGPQEDIAKSLGDADVVLLCEDCAMRNTPVAVLAEMASIPRPSPDTDRKEERQ